MIGNVTSFLLGLVCTCTCSRRIQQELLFAGHISWIRHELMNCIFFCIGLIHSICATVTSGIGLITSGSNVKMCVSVASLLMRCSQLFDLHLISMHSLCGWWGQPTYSGLDRILEAILAYAAQEEEQPHGATEGNYWSIECSLFSLFIPGSSRCRKVSLNARS